MNQHGLPLNSVLVVLVMFGTTTLASGQGQGQSNPILKS